MHEATEQTEALTDYRYIGSNPNNYVVFNSEIWRIIGVFTVDNGDGKTEERLKIVRNETIGGYSWDNKNINTGAEGEHGKNNWSDSRLNYLLNPNHENEISGGRLYWNSKNGVCYSGANNAIVSCDFTTKGLKEKARNMIDDALWYLGGSSTDDNVTVPMFYARERSKTSYNNRDIKWVGKVGLMYPSDYGYATSGGINFDRNTCLNKELYN